MCSPSSSAELPPVDEPARAATPICDYHPEAEQLLLQHGNLLGPCAAYFLRNLWVQATRSAEQQSTELLGYAHRYSPQRLERACERALLCRLVGLEAIRFILAEDLDRLDSRADADLDGQLLLPLYPQR